MNGSAAEDRSTAISAIVCTHNRSAYLRKAIRSLAGQTLPADQCEVIVVDNASTDDTRAVFDGFAGAANLRYIHEPVLGLSQARNTGWQHARGEYVAFLDDDAIACPDWLERILKAFDSAQPSPGSVGGRVLPIWETPRPAWLPKELEPALTIVDWGDVPTFIDIDRQFLAGTNVAYPASALRSVGGFSTALGRKGGSLLSSEEILVSRSLRRQGLRAYYDPSICVSHHIAAQRLTRGWLCQRHYSQGVSETVLRQLEAGKPSRLRSMREVLEQVPPLARQTVVLLWRLRQPGSSYFLMVRCSMCASAGRASAGLRMAISPDTGTGRPV